MTIGAALFVALLGTTTASAAARPADPSATGGPSPAGDPPGFDTSAARAWGWGRPSRAEDFDGPLGPQWGVYDGPGHVGNGRRTPDSVTVQGGTLTITGDTAGNTAGMAWNPGQKYGRWEGRVRAPAGDESYNALLLLWPDAENFPVGGEIDFMEMTDPARRSTELFLHHGPNNDQVSARVEIDGTQWHNWAVEWTPDHLAAFVDGREWFRTTDRSILPPGPMHLCIQLDWFPRGGPVRETTMEVDWVRQYTLQPAGAPSPTSAPSQTPSPSAAPTPNPLPAATPTVGPAPTPVVTPSGGPSRVTVGLTPELRSLLGRLVDRVRLRIVAGVPRRSPPADLPVQPVPLGDTPPAEGGR